MDLDDDGRRIVSVLLTEVTHAGIVAEYVAGTATTLMEAALDTEIQAIVEGTDITEFLSATQKTNLVLRTTTWPL